MPKHGPRIIIGNQKSNVSNNVTAKSLLMASEHARFPSGRDDGKLRSC